MTKIQQWIERAFVIVTGTRNPLGLEGFGLAEMEIRNHQEATSVVPKSSFRQKSQLLFSPAPGIGGLQDQQRAVCGPCCIGPSPLRINVPTFFPQIVTRSVRPYQLPIETLRWLEQRLISLERQQRYECAYALRMEVAEWLLGSEDANLTTPAFPEHTP